MIRSTFIAAIRLADMRYPSLGDYYEPNPGDGDFLLPVAETGDWRMNMLIALHELIELVLTQGHGTPEQVIAEWDKAYAKVHPDAEPGNDPRAPYHREHVFD